MILMINISNKEFKRTINVISSVPYKVTRMLRAGAVSPLTLFDIYYVPDFKVIDYNIIDCGEKMCINSPRCLTSHGWSSQMTMEITFKGGKFNHVYNINDTKNIIAEEQHPPTLLGGSKHEIIAINTSPYNKTGRNEVYDDYDPNSNTGCAPCGMSQGYLKSTQFHKSLIWISADYN
ncbi:MAG: hypothetical protein HQK79_08620 [Desulfobacterales bacterium]|nr:hypothetical protein [Desulfobacterales bacterium]MBF0397882.1 hypothetical protein [Desulfobacterales bacterium]